MSFDLEQYVKILSSDLKHKNFQYKEGENIDICPFDPCMKCSHTGLHFTKLKYIGSYVNYGTKIADVELLPDSKLGNKGSIWKTDKLIIKNIMDLKDHPCWKDLKACEVLVTEKHIPNLSNYFNLTFPDLIRITLKYEVNFGDAANNPPEIRMLCFSFGYIDNYLHYSDMHPEEYIQYIKNAFDSIFHPTLKHYVDLCRYEGRVSTLYNYQQVPLEIWMIHIMRDPKQIEYHKPSCVEIDKQAFRLWPEAIKYIRNVDLELALELIKRDVRNISKAHQTFELCMMALLQDGMAINQIEDRKRYFELVGWGTV